MASTPSTKDKERRFSQRGFTLVELMAAGLISLIVFAGLFSAYIYIARNVTRNSISHQHSLQSSRILHLFANDVGVATQVKGASNWQLDLQLPNGSIVSYTYHPDTQSLQRTSTSGELLTLNGISPLPLGFSSPSFCSNIFNYYNQRGASLLPAPIAVPDAVIPVIALVDIRQIELSFLITDGVADNGTLVRTPTLSSRIILRNKPPLGQ